MRDQHFATNIVERSVVAVNVNAQASGPDGVATWFEHRLTWQFSCIRCISDNNGLTRKPAVNNENPLVRRRRLLLVSPKISSNIPQ